MNFLQKSCFLVFCISSLYSYSDAIQYSGLSYISRNNDLQDLYPNTIKGEKELRKIIFSYLQDNLTKNSQLRLQASDSFKDGTLSLIIAVDNERVSSLYNENTKKCIRTYSLGAQIITFSSKDQQILSVQPYAARKVYLDPPQNNSCNYRNTRLEQIRFIGDFYLGMDIPSKDYDLYLSLSDTEMISKLTETSLITKSFSRDGSFLRPIFNNILSANSNDLINRKNVVGIEEINLGKTALKQLSGQGEFKENHFYIDFFGEFMEEAYKSWVGQEYTKWFSETYDYPLIPYVKGKALGKDLAIKFADSTDVLELKLPDLDYGFVINIKGFKKIKLDESKLRESYAWGAFSSIEFNIPGMKNITSIDLKHVETDEVNKADTADDWVYFGLSMNRTLKDYPQNVKQLDKKWLTKSSKMSSRDFKKNSKLILEKLEK